MEINGLVDQVLSGLDATHPVKPEPVSDADAASKSLEEILQAISNPAQKEPPVQEESALDKLIAELKKTTALATTGQNPPVQPDPFGPKEEWGEEQY
jgi:hypothetical protein